METLPKDISREMALNLSPADIVNFCSTNKKFNKEICDSNDFWRRKLEKDYPEEMKNIGEIKNPKNVYMKRSQYIFKLIEDFIPKMIENEFGDFAIYLNDEYKKDLFKALYKMYLDKNWDYDDVFYTFYDYVRKFYLPERDNDKDVELHPVIEELFFNLDKKETISDIILKESATK